MEGDERAVEIKSRGSRAGKVTDRGEIHGWRQGAGGREENWLALSLSLHFRMDDYQAHT